VTSVYSWVSVSLRRVRSMSERRFDRTPAGVCSLGLHLVWCSTYRRRILGGRVAARCGELLGQISAEHGWEVAMFDHVHLIVRVGPTDAPASVVRTSQIFRRRYSCVHGCLHERS
jgi:putative transposase